MVSAGIAPCKDLLRAEGIEMEAASNEKRCITTIKVEPVGRWFLSHWSRLNAHRGLSVTGSTNEERSGESSSDTDDDGDRNEAEIVFDDDIVYLRSLDPKEIKDQDHYRVLGLTHVRLRATEDQIRKAHRFKVLKHHPDKRRSAGEDIRDDDDYFTCITKAAEILSNPVKRRAYDSVDPTFDDSVPAEIKNKITNQLPAFRKEFYTTFGDAFDRNTRWSVRKHVPKLGDDAMTREQVEKFYKFWYEFESWREYSYLDEEDKEKGSDRDERRWIEKNNRVERAERKKEEVKRIRKLVDNAYSSDPRIARFMEEDKAQKAEKKRAKQDAGKARRDEEDRIKREDEEKERKERAEKEAAVKVKAETAKKEKEVMKKALKKERKALRTISKESDFFIKEEDEKLLHMTDLDRLCEILAVEQLEELNNNLNCGDVAAKRAVFLSAVAKLNSRQEEENLKMVERSAKGASGAEKVSGSGPTWSTDELSLLVKGVNLFPAGTNQRWEVVANFISQHTKTPEVERSAKETLNKAKEMQTGDFHLSQSKEDANKMAYEALEKQKKTVPLNVKVEAEMSQRTESAAELQGLNVHPWSEDEQKLLEQALKTHPASLGAERWERISSCLPDRSKKDCMRRYKELAEVVRAKRAAVAAQQKAKA